MSGRALRVLWAGLAAAALAGCGTAHILAARPLPVVLNPPMPAWGISVAIEPTDILRVRLVNDSHEPVSVLWDESAYIDVNNRSHPVKPASSQGTRSTIAPGTRLEETLVLMAPAGPEPLDPLLPAKGKTFGWLTGGDHRPRIGQPIDGGHPLVGKQIGLFLVLQRGDERKTLLARYDLEDGS